MKVSLQLIWPSIHAICGNYVFYKHTPSVALASLNQGYFSFFKGKGNMFFPTSAGKKRGILAFTLQVAPPKQVHP